MKNETLKQPMVPFSMAFVLAMIVVCAAMGCGMKITEVGKSPLQVAANHGAAVVAETLHPQPSIDVERIIESNAHQAAATRELADAVSQLLERDNPAPQWREPTPAPPADDAESIPDEFSHFKRSDANADATDNSPGTADTPYVDPVVAEIRALGEEMRAEREATRAAIERLAPTTRRRETVVSETGIGDIVYADEALAGYTGCVFWTENPAATELGNGTCLPCNELVRRIRALQTTNGAAWIVSTNRNSHFWLRQIDPDEAEKGIPCLETFRDGQSVGLFRGAPADLGVWIRDHHPSVLKPAAQVAPQATFPFTDAYGFLPQSQPYQQQAASGCSGGGDNWQQQGRQTYDPWPQASSPQRGARYVCRNGVCRWEY